MSDCEIGMLSTVLIGNSHTIVRHGLMVTPRGYANKYDMAEGGSTRVGERPGRSLSTGLNGWLENLLADHAAGDSIEHLAQRHRLPADYIRATLAEPLEASAAEVAEDSEG
jgi:precorrin-3B C17-methyltransferase